jgi:hypothetical protein
MTGSQLNASIPVTFMLSYVNLPEGTANYGRPFSNIYKLAQFVRRYHPDFTSYQVVVIRN